jgi:NADPH-dependent 2,4-dienoyl-CoA reductase/sulfur reductase-like enzyme/peroxiredoxin family protein/rhodanese-related sulfurtransferase/TusA-related sulfurtransferase
VNLKTGEEYSESYDKLLLSPGAEPVKPPIPGIEDEAILTLRNVPDTDRIKDYLKDHKVEKAVVVGGGFIGLEMAENLHQLGLAVTIVEMADQVMAPLDFEMAAEVHQHLKDKRVGLLLNDAVAAFKREAGGLVVQMQSGKTLQADLVILSIGVRPDSKLAADAGLDLAINKAILVNSHLQTSDPDIYAVGDAIALPNPITKKTMSTYLAGPANKQGRIAADNMVFGNKESYCGSINTAIAKVFDLTVAATGVSEKALKQEGLPYIASIVHASSHAGYYPDALSLSVKITFEPESGRLLGGQVLGYDGVDKRIDMLAQTIKREGTVYDLMEIEHAYAPPFSSAKDPVNVAGLVADNIIKGRVRIIHWDEISALDLSQTVLLDVREPEEHALGSIEGAINISVDELRKRLDEVPRGKKLVVFCRSGHRSYFASRILMQNGFNEVYNLSGGYMTYKNANQQQGNENAFAGESTHKDEQLQQNDQPKSAAPSGKIIEADACGLQCPGPIMRLKQEMDKLANGDQLRITATDQGFAKDVPAWCQMTGNTMVEVRQEGRKIIATIQKGGAQEISSTAAGKNKTMIVFSDDLDRVLASFVIANGAATTGKKVTMFFTFWGLNVIKRKDSPKLKKDFMGKMFGMMLPSSSKGLGLSKINFAGLGPVMMRQRMKDKNVDSLEMMIRQAQMAGVQMIACQMSMDIMGVQAEELIDGVKIGGVATYLAEAEQANINLFI